MNKKGHLESLTLRGWVLFLAYWVLNVSDWKATGEEYALLKEIFENLLAAVAAITVFVGRKRAKTKLEGLVGP